VQWGAAAAADAGEGEGVGGTVALRQGKEEGYGKTGEGGQREDVVVLNNSNPGMKDCVYFEREERKSCMRKKRERMKERLCRSNAL
jgi:hypothetical protein